MQRLVQDLLTYSRVGTKGKELLKTSGGGLGLKGANDHCLDRVSSIVRGVLYRLLRGVSESIAKFQRRDYFRRDIATICMSFAPVFNFERRHGATASNMDFSDSVTLRLCVLFGPHSAIMRIRTTERTRVYKLERKSGISIVPRRADQSNYRGQAGNGP